MKVIPKNEHQQPLVTETGEIIYELVGLGANREGNPSHSLARIIIPPGKSSSTHYHQSSQESYFILAGEGWMQINQESFQLQAGDVCFLQEDDIHRIENRGNKELEFLAVCAPAWTPGDSFEIQDED